MNSIEERMWDSVWYSVWYSSRNFVEISSLNSFENQLVIAVEDLVEGSIKNLIRSAMLRTVTLSMWGTESIGRIAMGNYLTTFLSSYEFD